MGDRGKYPCKCKECDKSFYVGRYTLGRKRTFCSNACRQKSHRAWKKYQLENGLTNGQPVTK